MRVLGRSIINEVNTQKTDTDIKKKKIKNPPKSLT